MWHQSYDEQNMIDGTSTLHTIAPMCVFELLHLNSLPEGQRNKAGDHAAKLHRTQHQQHNKHPPRC